MWKATKVSRMRLWRTQRLQDAGKQRPDDGHSDPRLLRPDFASDGPSRREAPVVMGGDMRRPITRHTESAPRVESECHDRRGRVWYGRSPQTRWHPGYPAETPRKPAVLSGTQTYEEADAGTPCTQGYTAGLPSLVRPGKLLRPCLSPFLPFSSLIFEPRLLCHSCPDLIGFLSSQGIFKGSRAGYAGCGNIPHPGGEHYGCYA